MMRAAKFVFLAAGLALIAGFAGSQAYAQRVPVYNKASEVTVTGTVQSIQFAKESATLPHGTYLTLQTVPITYTVHMGMFPPSAIPFKVGDTVTITGVLASIKGTQVLLARTLQSSSATLTIRTSNGLALRPPPSGAPSGGSSSQGLGGQQ